MTPVMIYVTASGAEEAKSIGRALVEARLAACANVIPAIDAIYRWQGKVEECREAVLILKTTEDKVPTVVAQVRALHSYACPCVVALPIVGGHKDFLDWIAAETA